MRAVAWSQGSSLLHIRRRPVRHLLVPLALVAAGHGEERGACYLRGMGKLRARAWKGAAVAVISMLCGTSSILAQEDARGNVPESASIRVGCLGDSITAGQVSGVEGPEGAHFSYPTILGSILGHGFEVRGFGAGGHSLRADTPRVFASSDIAARAIEFAPDVAVIMLGTNDTVVRAEYQDWAQDVDGLVGRLRSANPDVLVWLSSPPQMFPGREGLQAKRRANLEERKPRLDALTETLKAIAVQRDGVNFIDVRDALRPRDVTDGVHPNPIGAERLAYRFADAILGEPVWRAGTPVPAIEYRGRSAGWGGGTWREAYASLKALAVEARDEAPADVLFLGDSITQALTGHTKRWSKPGGTRVFDKFHGERRAVSVGLSGDRTEHILYRIQDGSLDGFRPRKIVLQIGINNVNAAGHQGYWVYHGIVAVVKALELRFPTAHILVAGPFPGGVSATSRVRTQLEGVHYLLHLAQFGPLVDLLFLQDLFVGPDGELLETMAKDGVHITPIGQRRWMEALEPYFVDPLVTEQAGGLTIVLAEGVSVEVSPRRGLRSLTVDGLILPARDARGKEWMLDGFPAAMRVIGYRVRGASVRVAMECDLASWEADSQRQATTVPIVEDTAETWRLASLGAARGYDRLLTTKHRSLGLGDYATITTRQQRGPLAWKVNGRPIKDFQGYSTVSDGGLTYDISRIEVEGGATGWWFRSGAHLMSQAVNFGKNPTLREVVLVEPAGTDPIPLDDVIRAYASRPKDRRLLLGR